MTPDALGATAFARWRGHTHRLRRLLHVTGNVRRYAAVTPWGYASCCCTRLGGGYVARGGVQCAVGAWLGLGWQVSGGLGHGEAGPRMRLVRPRGRVWFSRVAQPRHQAKTRQRKKEWRPGAEKHCSGRFHPRSGSPGIRRLRTRKDPQGPCNSADPQMFGVGALQTPTRNKAK